MRPYQILYQVDQAMKRVETGLILVNLGNYSQGMYDVVIYGRSVTNILQKLRGVEPSFNEWYQPFREEMKNDELMKFFYKLRSQMLKEGISPVSIEVGLEPFNLKKIQEKYPKPKNATRLVLGTGVNGSFYEVKNADGSIEKKPVDFKVTPRIIQRFTDGPKTHLGINIEGETAIQMAEYFVVYLRKLITSAHDKFSRKQKT